MGRTLEELIRAGRPASVFCRLARTRFTGVVYAEHDEGGGIFSFREGMPVFAEDLGDTPLLADDLLARGLIDAAQYAEIAARVIELGPDDEDIGFCEVAVELGVLAAAQVDAELERRLRGRIVQAVGWSGCRIEVDGDPDSVAGVAQYPQDLGPLIATGVRTFCDEATVRELIGPLETLYVRPTVSEAESVQFFELGDEDEALLSSLKADVPVERSIDGATGDWLESWHVVLMLVIAEHVEVGRAPFVPATERSGLRSSHAITSPGGRYVSTTGVREERVRTDSIGRLPAVTGATTVPSTSGASPAGRDTGRTTSGPTPASTVARAGSQTSTPIERTRPASAAAPTPAAAERTTLQGGTRATTTSATRSTATTVDLSSTSEPRSVPRRDPKRKLSTALQRLERNLKDLRQTAPVAHAAAPSMATATPTSSTATVGGTRPARAPSATVTAPGDAQRAHVEALLRMRYGKRPESTPQAGKASEPGKAAPELFRQAQDLMRDNQWPRAHETMRKVCELDSANELYTMYQRWTALRSNLLDEDGMSKLRASLRDKLADETLGKFAYYALGHLALAEKKDDAAEKLFKKALELDKHNKDAERHLRIIELRRKSAKEQANNKIFGIEIGKKKS